MIPQSSQEYDPSNVAYKEVKKEKPPFVNVPEPEAELEAQIPEELLCMVCRGLLQDAVLIPCCGNSFCDECVRQVLLDSDNHECPLCHETGISPDTVIPNRFLRTSVLNFRNETGYTRVKRAPQIPFPQPSHMDSPQPSPDSTVENQDPPTDPVVEEAVEDTSVLPVATVPEPETVESESNQPSESETHPPTDPLIQDEADENVEQSNEDQQPGTPLEDEPPVHNVLELELNEHEQYLNHNQYDEENKFSYSHYYNENMESDSRDEGHVSSSEINQISTIETIITRHYYKPCSGRPPHFFAQQRPGHHVECDYNRDRPDYRDRYDRRNRDRPANTGRFTQHSHSRYERPQDSRYNQSEYHAESYDDKIDKFTRDSRQRSLSRSRSQSKSRSYSRSRSLSRSRTRSRSRVRHRRDSRERVRPPIISIGHSSTLSSKLNRPRNHRSPFQVKHSYSSSPYKPSYPVQYGGSLQPPPVLAAPPPALPHNVTRPHLQQIHTVQPITHPPPLNHYSTNEYHPERPSMYGHTYDDQYHGYNSYQRPYVPPRYQPRNARFNKPPQEHPRHSEEMQLRIPGWTGNRRRNYKSGYQQQGESREQQQQRRENTKVAAAKKRKYESSVRIAVNETIKARIENKIHDKKPNRVRSKHNRDDHRPSKLRDISHDESGFEPNLDYARVQGH